MTFSDILEKIKAGNRATVLATPNPSCPCCTAKALHPPEELKRYHSLAGHGRNGATLCQCKNAGCPCKK